MLGALAGMAVALMFGKWIFWLALGLVIGILLAQLQRELAGGGAWIFG
jgi:hypothetical protein